MVSTSLSFTGHIFFSDLVVSGLNMAAGSHTSCSLTSHQAINQNSDSEPNPVSCSGPPALNCHIVSLFPLLSTVHPLVSCWEGSPKNPSMKQRCSESRSMREERHRRKRKGREEVRKGAHEERMEGTMPLDVTHVFSVWVTCCLWLILVLFSALDLHYLISIQHIFYLNSWDSSQNLWRLNKTNEKHFLFCCYSCLLELDILYVVLMANDGVLELLFNQSLMVNGEVLEVTHVLVITEKVLSCEVPCRRSVGDHHGY